MGPRRVLACLAILALSAAPAMGQCTPGPNNFCVTEGVKTASNPNQGGWCCNAWYIDGTEAKVLTLTRGETYTFRMVNVSIIHRFYLSTSVIGGGPNAYTNGVTPTTPVSGNATLTFVVPASAPNLLYYQCSTHQRMGWEVNIVDPAPCFADYNGDGFVDGIDYDSFLNDFESSDPAQQMRADLNGDGFVDGIDYDEFMNHFEAGC